MIKNTKLESFFLKYKDFKKKHKKFFNVIKYGSYYSMFLGFAGLMICLIFIL